MNHRLLGATAIDPGDRGLGYGDGLFESMRLHAGRLPWWDRHWARLARGAARLGIPMPDEATVRAEAEGLGGGEAAGVIKLLLTRGRGGRGYQPPAEPQPTVLITRHPLPPAWPDDGLVLRWCELRLARQPALAGLKHCNRLEQVLARAEWREEAVHEGLLRDDTGALRCATAANVLVRIGGAWLTPRVDAAGVAGVCRGWLLEQGLVREAGADLDLAAVEGAEALALCNAVRGILPVARLGARRWDDLAPALALRARLASAEPAFAAQA